jgi:hypothetical protein
VQIAPGLGPALRVLGAQEVLMGAETMDEHLYITVRSPRLGHGLYDGYVTVEEESVYAASDALRVRVAG